MPFLAARLHDRAADIAAAADHQVGLHLPQDGRAARSADGQMPQRDQVAPDIVERQLALKAVDLDVMEGIARLGDQAVLHPLTPAGEMNLRGGIGCLQGRRQWQAPG